MRIRFNETVNNIDKTYHKGETHDVENKTQAMRYVRARIATAVNPMPDPQKEAEERERNPYNLADEGAAATPPTERTTDGPANVSGQGANVPNDRDHA